MGFKVIIKSEAHADTLEAFNFYEAQSVGLGFRFLDALNVCYNQLRQHPYHYGFIDEDPGKTFRDIRIKRFPFVVVFEIIDAEVIVYAVFDSRMDPEKKISK